MQGSTTLRLRLGDHLIPVARSTAQQSGELGVVVESLLEHQQRMEHLVFVIDALAAQLAAPIFDPLVERLRSDHACLQSLISQLLLAKSTG
jgi:hypothetical protein